MSFLCKRQACEQIVVLKRGKLVLSETMTYDSAGVCECPKRGVHPRSSDATQISPCLIRNLDAVLSKFFHSHVFIAFTVSANSSGCFPLASSISSSVPSCMRACPACRLGYVLHHHSNIARGMPASS